MLDPLPRIDHKFFDVAVILASTYLSGIVASFLRVPKVTGYVFAGLLLGPSLLDLVGHETIRELSFLDDVALGLIVFTIGREFGVAHLRRLGAALAVITLTQAVTVFTLVAGVCCLFFWHSLGPSSGLLLGLIAVATAPAATLLVLREYDSEGPVTEHLLAMVGLTNILCIVLATLAMFAMASGQSASMSFFDTLLVPIGKIAGSVVLGTGIGLGVSYAQTKRLERIDAILVVFVAILLGTGISKAWGMDALLTNLTIGIVHINSAVRGPEFFAALKTVDLPIYMIFFFLTGANMRLDLLSAIWPVVLVYSVARSVGKVAGTFLGCRMTERSDTLRRYLGWGMLSQAGVAIGLAYSASEFGVAGARELTTVILASTVLFEVIGPIAIKMAVAGAAEVKAIKLMVPLTASVWRGDISSVIEELRTSLGIPSWKRKRFEGELRVRHILRQHIERIPHDAKFNEILRALEHSRYTRLPVISKSDEFLGFVALDDLRDVVFDRALNSSVIAWDLVSTPDPDHLVFPDEPIRELVPRFETSRVQLLPVVDAENHRSLLGIVTQRDVLTAAFEHGHRQSDSSKTAP